MTKKLWAKNNKYSKKIECTRISYCKTSHGIVTIVPTYPVNDNFPFIQRLNEIHRRVRCAGLHEKWRRENEIDLWIHILKKYNRFETRANVSENTDLLPIPIFIMYGWVAGTITLILEIIWKNYYYHLQTYHHIFQI